MKCTHCGKKGRAIVFFHEMLIYPDVSGGKNIEKQLRLCRGCMENLLRFSLGCINQADNNHVASIYGGDKPDAKRILENEGRYAKAIRQI